jgi:hypothetical protein
MEMTKINKRAKRCLNRFLLTYEQLALGSNAEVYFDYSLNLGGIKCEEDDIAERGLLAVRSSLKAPELARIGSDPT